MSRAAPSTARKATKAEYVETDTGNKISRKARIEGKPNIILGGRSVIMAEVVLRGDLHRSEGGDKGPTTAISIGRYTVVATGSTLHPPSRISRGQLAYYPMRIGDNVFIGPGCVISAASISSHVYIGAGAVLGPFVTVRESCKICAGAVLPPHMVVPAGSVVAGSPAQIVGEVGAGWGAGAGEFAVEGGDLRELVRSIK